MSISEPESLAAPPPSADDDERDLLPARMVNEFVYCPRLFYLEWVRGLWAENEFTADGTDVHRNVDLPAGIAPGPQEAGKTIVRGMTLTSAQLGVVARLDIVEFDGNTARPVDYKRGRPAPVNGGVWPPEQIQLGIQALLLREAGYHCTEGVVYFAEANKRVTVPITSELEQQVREAITTATRTAASPTAPPPLIDSPKCPSCVLVAQCLPDELNLLLHRRSARPRTLITREPAARPLYLVGAGTQLRKEDNHFIVKPREGEAVRLRAIDISHVAAFGQVWVSTAALHALLAQESPVLWLTRGGRFLGMTTGLLGKNIELRRRQYTLSPQQQLELARAVVIAKIRNQRTLLRRNARWEVSRALQQLAEAAERARTAADTDALRGIEGFAGRIYFHAFAAMLRNDLPFQAADLFLGRNRRPPRDPVNALLSFAYSLLVKDLTVQAQAVGFDPYCGFYHRQRFGRPGLALDMAEEFRPLIGDSVVVTALNNRELTPDHLRRQGTGWMLTDEGRRTFLRVYERRLEHEVRHPHFGYRLTYRRLIDLQLRFLGASLLGELPRYEGFTTR